MLHAAPASPEYQSDIRQLALRMMLQAKDAEHSVLVGAVVTCAAAMLMQLGEGEKDVDALADRIRLAIADTLAARKQ